MVFDKIDSESILFFIFVVVCNKSLDYSNTYKMQLDQPIMVIRVANEIHWIPMEHKIDFELMIDNRYSLHDQQRLN